MPAVFIAASSFCASTSRDDAAPAASVCADHVRIERTSASLVRIAIRNASASTIPLVTSKLRLSRRRMF